MPKWHIWGWQILLPFSYLNNKRYLLEGSGKCPEFKWNTQASECTGTMVVFRNQKSQTMSLGLISKLPVSQHGALYLAIPLRLQGIRQGLRASANERGCFCHHQGELGKKECFQATCFSSFLWGHSQVFMNLHCPTPTTTACEKETLGRLSFWWVS